MTRAGENESARGTIDGARLQRAPALFAAGLSALCLLVLFLSRQWALFLPTPLLLSGDRATPAEIGRCLAGVLAIGQAAAVVLYAPWLGARWCRAWREHRQEAATLRVAVTPLVLLLVASLPVAVAAWLAGGWDATALLGLYTNHALLGLAFAAAGAGLATLRSPGAARAAVAVLCLAGTLGLCTARLEWSPEPDGALAFASPGYGLTLFFRGEDPAFDPAGPRGWIEHFAVLVAVGVVGGVAVRRRLAT